MGVRSILLSQLGRLWAFATPGLRYQFLRLINPTFILGVVGIIEDQGGRVLLLKHRFRTPWPWGLPGGYARRGEDFRATLERELAEEIGAPPAIESEVLDLELKPRYGNLTVCLRGRMDSSAPLSLSDEILESRWCRQDELPSDISPYHRELILRLQGRARAT
jgi:8-oxo-dGTP pyrophosphatase MutT (NUDIX family)